MARLLLLISLLIPTFSLSAQGTLSLSPEVVELDVDESQFETVAHSWLVNTSDETKTYRWVRIVESVTEGWESAICDFNACYNTTVDSSITDLELGPNDTTNLDVHIRPMGIDGIAHVKLVVFEVDNPDNSIEGNYYFNQIVSSNRNVQAKNLKLFPNPAHDYFQLSDYEDIERVIIYSMAGAELKSFVSYPNESFQIAELHRGLYLVRLLNRRKEVVKALRLNKR